MENIHNSFKNEKNLKIIKKKEYTIYYSCTHKYPLLVAENLNKNTGKIIGDDFSKNKNIEYPLRIDEDIPIEYMFTEDNYNDYMDYGGSYGQNAPSINHKTNINTYLDTFKLSNLSPREVTLNNGMWYILEFWSRNLIKSNEIENIHIYTGSITGKKNIKINNSNINVPSHCFKIITANDINDNNTMYIACFLIPNKKPVERIYKLYKYLTSLKDICKISGIDFFQIFKYHSDFNELSIIQSLKRKIRIDIHLNDNKHLINQIKTSIYYGNLIYSENLLELNTHWNKCIKLNINNNIHQLYYNKAKNRILQKKDITKIQNLHLLEKSKKKRLTPTKKSKKKYFIDNHN